MKSIYICCSKHLQPVYRAEAEYQFQSLYKVSEKMEDADLVYAVGEVTTSMERELIQANRQGIPIVYVDEKFRNVNIYKGLLNNRKQVKVVAKAKEKDFDMER